MSRLIDLTGQKFNRLIVLKRYYKMAHPVYWLCRCDCGKEHVVEGNKIKSGEIKSCGCLKQEFVDNGGWNKKHGLTKTRIYSIWRSMKQRCTNPVSAAIKKNYQDRGITVCSEWHDFEKFKNWAFVNGYSENLTIERMDNNKGYSPDNCKWATITEQANNKRSNAKITYNGVTQNISQWARQLNIRSDTLRQRLINLGWSVEKALSTPVVRRGLA